MITKPGDLILDNFRASIFSAGISNINKLILIEGINGDIFLLS